MARNPWWAPWALANLIEPSMRKLTKQIPEIARMKAGESVLDLCCGTGGLAIIYAQAGMIATGIDIDPRVIAIANRRISVSSLPNISFQTASALEMPFDDDSFDYVSITMGIHEVSRPDRDAIISEMRRVVKNGGSFVFLDYMTPMPKLFHLWIANFAEFIAGRDHHQYFKDYLHQGGLMGLLSRHHLPGERKRELSLVEIVIARNELPDH